MMDLREDQLSRYSRHLALKEVGEDGQRKLLQSKVLVVGAGGLGSPVAYYLAAAGVGHIGIVDSDTVDRSNLNRQILYGAYDVGIVKVEKAKEKLITINPDVNVTAFAEKIDAGNAEKICSGYDVVIDCLDNFTARFIINDICLKFKIPLVHAGVHKYFGQTFTIVPGQGPCLRCIYPEIKEMESPQYGILGVVPGILGTLQVMETMKILLQIGEIKNNNLLYFDGLNLNFEKIKITPREDCICQKQCFI
jgi:molybdopterin/thiamine biosynthesis adenylyltransferase